MTPLDTVRQAIADVLHPANFFAAGVQLQWEHLPTDTTPWDIHHGQLAPRRLSRETQAFESWNVFRIEHGQASGEPLLSLKLDAERCHLHVVRGLLCWTWEGYHAGDNVYLSREVQRWGRELVGTLSLAPSSSGTALRDELALWVFRAVVGVSRLPLTSVEAPLPGYSVGDFAYFHIADRSAELAEQDQRPMASWRQLIENYRPNWRPELRTKWLEFLMRCVPADEVAQAAVECGQLWRKLGQDAAKTIGQYRSFFNDMALSPYTDFVEKSLLFLHHLVDQKHLTTENHVDFLGWLLRQLARHLTAYDLITFHHRGANYPDALLLDAAIKDALRLCETHPHLLMGDDGPSCLRRRALRLAWLHRRRYEGHPVPDAPTSPGENVRVLPPPHVRVPEEQILNPAKRSKRLYDGDSLANYVGKQCQGILRECGKDLQKPAELRELGIGIFIERPLGFAKAPGETDLSPLLAHETYSQSLAERALMELGREALFGLVADDIDHMRKMLAKPTGGIPTNTVPTEPPRIVSLADAAKAASDFVILRTLPGSVRAFCAWPEVAALLRANGIRLDEKASWLIVGNVTSAGRPGVLMSDTLGHHKLQFDNDTSQGLKLASAILGGDR
jgi:hypothetical protein